MERTAKALILCAVVQQACGSGPTENFHEPTVKIATSTVDRLMPDSLYLTVTVSEQDGQLRRVASLTNRANRSHTVSWLPYCGDLVWLLLDPAKPTGTPRYNASRGAPCNLTATVRTLAAGETYAAPEWQVLTRASKFMGDSLPPGVYSLGILVNISDMAPLLQVGPIEFVKP